MGGPHEGEDPRHPREGNVAEAGSRSSAGTGTLAPGLADEKPGFQDFVIVHELLHLRVGQHGQLFRAMMTLHVRAWQKHDATRRISSSPKTSTT